MGEAFMRVTTRWSKIALFAVLGLLVSGLTPVAVASAAGPGLVWTRVAGADRYETAAAVSKSGFPGGASAAVVASGELFPDGLTATYLAGQVGGPVLLTGSSSLPGATVAELTRLHVSTVYVAGGTAAVSVAVADQLATLRAPNGQAVSVVRLAGADRYATAAAIAARFPKSSVGMVGGERVALLASGTGFADALSGSAAAAGAHLPLLLTTPDALSPQVLPTLQALGVSRVMVLGGTDAISGAVATQLTGAGLALTRLGGADRVATATLIASWEVASLGFAGDQVAIARGDEAGGGVDALSLGAFIGAGKHPLLLAASPSALGDGLLSWLRADTALTGGVVAGGPAAISEALMQELSGIVGGPVGSPTPPLVPPPTTTATTVVSDGGTTKVTLGNVTVIAPPGSIAAGQTLSLEQAPPAGMSPEDAPSLLGGPYRLTTSQGQPLSPVTVSVTYDPGLLTAGTDPMILHGDPATGLWLPEVTTVDTTSLTVTATLTHFSFLDVVSRIAYVAAGAITYGAGVFTGNRGSVPTDCATTLPTWVNAVTLTQMLNESLPACISTRSTEQTLYVNIVNNRGYLQMVHVQGSTIDLQDYSVWDGSNLESYITNGLAKAESNPAVGDFALGDGQKATIAFSKPAGLVGTRDITIAHNSQAVTAVASLGFSLLLKYKNYDVPDDVRNCVVASLHNELAGSDATSEVAQMRSCISAQLSYAVAAGILSDGAAKNLEKISWAVLAIDAGYKIVDLFADAYDQYAAPAGFTEVGLNLLNANIVVGNINRQNLPAGVPTSIPLSATGGTAPYTFSIWANAANLTKVPAWLHLNTVAGTLDGTPPYGDKTVYTFYIYATDATGQHSPFNRDTVTIASDGAVAPVAPSYTWTPQQAPEASGITLGATSLTDVTCPASGACVAIGTSALTPLDTGGVRVPILEVQSGSTWSASRAPLPAGTSPGSNGYLATVACASRQFCVAAGSYLLIGAGSSWNAVEIPLPIGAPPASYVSLDGLACRPGGDCFAVGSYSPTFGVSRLMVVRIPAIGSPTATDVQPSGVDSTYGDSQIACPSAALCMWTSAFVTNAGPTVTLFAGVISDTPAPPQSLPLPADSSNGGAMTALACSNATFCVATGEYMTPLGLKGVVERLNGGIWDATDVPLAGASNADGIIGTAGCGALMCLTTLWMHHAGTTLSSQTLEVSPAGVSAISDVTPTTATSPSHFYSISCPGDSSCVAVGSYRDDSARPVFRPYFLWDTSQQVTATLAPVLPDGDDGLSGGMVYGATSVACTADGTCVAVGSYYDTTSASAQHGLIQVGVPQ
jgi:putative cell wall-binding protein